MVYVSRSESLREEIDMMKSGEEKPFIIYPRERRYFSENEFEFISQEKFEGDPNGNLLRVIVRKI